MRVPVRKPTLALFSPHGESGKQLKGLRSRGVDPDDERLTLTGRRQIQALAPFILKLCLDYQPPAPPRRHRQRYAAQGYRELCARQGRLLGYDDEELLLDVVYDPNTDRCRLSAEDLRDHMLDIRGDMGVPHFTPRLRGIGSLAPVGIGTLAGTTTADWPPNYKREMKLWETEFPRYPQPPRAPVPGSEPPSLFLRRCQRAFAEGLDTDSRRVLFIGSYSVGVAFNTFVDYAYPYTKPREVPMPPERLKYGSVTAAEFSPYGPPVRLLEPTVAPLQLDYGIHMPPLPPINERRADEVQWC